MDLRELLEEHRQFLRESCRAFDEGFEGEAKRLAVSARVLLHNTPKSHALLVKLGKVDITFWDTCIPFDPSNLVPHLGLVRMRIGKGGAAYDAPLNDRPPSVPLRWRAFKDWWFARVIDDRRGNCATRRDLVLALANKEGGAHVDEKLTPAYRALTRERQLAIPVVSDGVRLPMLGRVELVSMRQIAHEILESLDYHFPKT